MHTRWLFFFINWERITQIVWHHMEFFLHIMYFLCRRCERRGLQGVLFRRRRRKKKAVCMVRREVGVVEWGGGGGSRGLVGRSKHAQRKYASCTRWTWGPARASLKVTGEACAERSRREKPCSSSPHATRFPLHSALSLLSLWQTLCFSAAHRC